MLRRMPNFPVAARNRPVRQTLGAGGRWTLIAIVLGLALIGFLHLTRGTAVRHVRGVTVDGAPSSVNEPEFPLMATMATGGMDRARPPGGNQPRCTPRHSCRQPVVHRRVDEFRQPFRGTQR